MKTLLTVAALIAVAVGIYFVRQATIGRDTPPMAGSSLEIILEASTVREPDSATMEMATALLRTCRLQVNSTLVEDQFERLSEDVFRFVLKPNLIERDEQQLRGCLEDTRIQHLTARVLTMQELRPGESG